MKILVVAMLYDYGKKERGYSYEYYNFYLSLKEVYKEVEFYDFFSEYTDHGKDAMNKQVLEKVKNTKYDVVLFSLYTYQFIPDTIKEIGKYTKTLCFFHDDTWRRDFSIYWAQYFDYFTTTDIYGEERYKKIGLPNAIYFPWGCNQHIYHKLDLPKIYDVSFVGGYHPWREWLIKLLHKEGIQVEVFGTGWKNGHVEQDDMIRIFNQSKINLNLSNSASWDLIYMLSSPKAFINTLKSKKNSEQMKARHFEINGCGGFQLSYYVEGLEHNYEIGKEIAIYNNSEDLVDKVKYYLANEEERETIALAGYNRTITEYTFDKRFAKAFEKMRIK